MEQNLGQHLQLARTQRGLSLADVSHATRVPQARLQQLEEGNLAAFGNMAYARSFARIYSQYLDVDAEAWINTLPQPVFAGAEDYRYLTRTFGPWVEPLRKRVRVSIHRPDLAPPRRRRWHALMLFVIIALGSLVLRNQFLSRDANPRAMSVTPSASAPVLESSRASAQVLAYPTIMAHPSKLVTYAGKAPVADVNGSARPLATVPPGKAPSEPEAKP